MGLDERGAYGLVLVGEHAGEFEAAEGVDAGFERGDAQQAPLGIGERLDERALGISGRLPLSFAAGGVSGVVSGVLGWQEDGAAGETGLSALSEKLVFQFPRWDRRKAGHYAY